jgi:autoinducer 2-degrading protein
MYVVVVNVSVKPEHRASFVEACRRNHEGSRAEPGNLRWDLLQSEEDPDKFVLYEVYRQKSDLEAHQKTAHYLRWREEVKDWMAAPRQRRPAVAASRARRRPGPARAAGRRRAPRAGRHPRRDRAPARRAPRRLRSIALERRAGGGGR